MSRDLLLSLYRSDFRAFIGFAFREAYPAKVFVDGWYLDIVADELMRCNPDGAHRLMLNLPPRYLKSFCASIAWPLFMAARNPGLRICVIAGTRELAAEFSDLRQRLLDSRRLKHVFPQLKDREVGETLTFLNKSQIVQSHVARSQIGRGADVFVIDDPLPARHARNPKMRNIINAWYDDEIVARLSRKDKASLIIVMQRLHHDDLCGHVLKSEANWRRAALPAIARKDERWELGDGRVIRRAAGEILCDQIETNAALRNVLMEMKGVNFRAQYLQEPAQGLTHSDWRIHSHFCRVPEDWKPGEPKLLPAGGFYRIPAEHDVLWEYFSEPNPFLAGRDVTEEECLIEFKEQQDRLMAQHRQDQ